MSNQGLGHRDYRTRRAIVLATSPPICWLCGKPVDLTLDGRTPDGPTVDHRTPRSAGGTNHPDNLAVAHKRCNSARGNRSPLHQASRDW